VQTDTTTFETFFRTEHARLYRAMCLVVGNRHEAEDVLQVAFLRVYERWERVRAMDDARGYLYRVAMNEFRSRYRRSVRAAKRAVSLAPPPDDAFVAIEDHEAVRAALRELIPQQRAAIVLTALLGYTSEEAGEVLGMAPSTVRVLSTRARKVMRERAGER